MQENGANSKHFCCPILCSIETLLENSDADVKVLTTYVKPETYPANEHAERLVDFLNKDKVRNLEWLFIVAPWYPEEAADFVAHYIHPSFEHELVMIPSGKWPKW